MVNCEETRTQLLAARKSGQVGAKGDPLAFAMLPNTSRLKQYELLRSSPYLFGCLSIAYCLRG